jgi:glycosyltransferase involved in cell wall biosynthesis
MSGIDVLRTRLAAPKRLGGLRATGRQLRRGPLRDVDVLWVNEPSLGAQCLRRGLPAIYDVTDDWREFSFSPRIRRRLVRAENRLAVGARTVVCSEELSRRWQSRYGPAPTVVPNGIDASAWLQAAPRVFSGDGLHVGYIGTLQDDRLDVGLVRGIADSPAVGTVHLVGPDALGDESRRELLAHPKIAMHGAVPATEVPDWATGLDVLVCPHKITPFTMSLDAIKSYEYRASGRPVVATPTSGFQHDRGAGWRVVADPQAFVDAVAAASAAGATPVPRSDISDMDWSRRTQSFAAEIRAAMADTLRPEHV